MTEGVYPKRVRPLPWWGGKQRAGKARWIADLLPWVQTSTYAEPFGGMAAVLCYRAPVKCEIYNDREERVVNWFRVLRERPDEFFSLLAMTPHSRAEYERAHDMLDHLDPVIRAWAFHVVIGQGVYQTLNGRDWVVTRDGAWPRHWNDERVKTIAARFSTVQLENKDGVDLLEWLADCSHAVIYCDPPYRSSTVNKYSHSEVDVDRMTEALRVQKGRVAVSGYGEEWDHLKWQRHERKSSIATAGANQIGEERIEVLWTNYDPQEGKNIGGLFNGMGV